MPKLTIDQDLARKVKRGAEVLDGAYPRWWRAIVMDVLAMDDCYDCILGHLYGHYRPGISLLRGRNLITVFDDPADLGFTVSRETCNRASDGGVVLFDQLADLWRAEIRKRMGGKESPCSPSH